MEFVDVIDENGRVIEVKPLDYCVRLGLLHRAISVFVMSISGQIYLQQRSKSDSWLPGLWIASCTGHVKSGELPEEATSRELMEELGLEGRPIYLFKLVSPYIQYGERIEHEMNYVFEYTTADELVIDRNEVEQMRLLSIQDCKRFFASNVKEITLDA